MKRFNWLLIGALLLPLAMVLLAGGGVPQADYDELDTEYMALQADYDELNTEYEAVQNALAEVEAVYPPKDFSSLSELNEWLLENDVSERPASTTAEHLYSKALEIQENALEDGYIVSADIDYDPTTELFFIACVTIIDGDIWAWDPETDEPINYSQMVAFFKVR